MKNKFNVQFLKIFHLPLTVSHTSRSIVFVLEGKCTVKRFSIIKEFKEGDVFFINTHEVTSISSKQGCIVEWIDFDTTIMNHDENSLLSYLNLTDSVGSMDQQKDMAEIYRDCVFTKNLLQAEKKNEICIQEIIEALFVDYHEFHQNTSISNQQIEWILNIHKQILSNINKKVSLQDLADSLNIKKSNLATLYKQLTNMTLLEWVNIQRLKKAEEYLLFNEMSHQEIIKECGFSDSKYFYRYFNEQFQMTPLMWKEKMKKSEPMKIQKLNEKEKGFVLMKMSNQLSGLKTETHLYQKAMWIREIRSKHLLDKDTIIEIDLLHKDNYIEVANERINAWYGFDLIMNELKKTSFEIELKFHLTPKVKETDLEEVLLLLKKSSLRYSSKILKCWKYVLTFHNIEEFELAKKLQKQIEKEFKTQDVIIKVI